MSHVRALDLGELGFRLGFVRLDELRPHEEIIPAELSSLVRSMESDGFQSDPLMVDGVTLTVLDGAHRLAALGELGARWAVAALVDYEDSRIAVARWLRSMDPRPASGAATGVGMAQVGDWRTAVEAVDSSRGRVAVLMPSGPSYLSQALGGCVEAHRLARTVWSRVPAGEASLIPDDRVGAALESGAALVYPPAPLKEEVIISAASGDLFPPKSTRHIFHARPLGIDVPLEVLRSSEPDLDIIRGRTSMPRVLPPNSEFRGRRYEDRVVLFQ